MARAFTSVSFASATSSSAGQARAESAAGRSASGDTGWGISSSDVEVETLSDSRPRHCRTDRLVGSSSARTLRASMAPATRWTDAGVSAAMRTM
ncbi:hypothetical protein [Brevibacterium aurantiacum]|uniref:Uncharacterized protein n=1 Tax=Brevibacterium aurantiacum TaxID=273384 RepID=A0A2A3YQV5_BREAU|nr:hypothetical protein CIK65_15055 [Brevibacterium aurantiacum]